MSEIITLISIGIALSMDVFSLALSIGMCRGPLNCEIIFSFLVALFHFVLPLIGLEIGIEIFWHLKVNFNIIIGVALIIIALSMLSEFKKKDDDLCETQFNFIGIIFIALSVSFDSFITGIGILAITSNILLAVFIFAILSFIFSFLGLTIGKYAQKKLGIYSTIVGIVLLLIIAITFLCK